MIPSLQRSRPFGSANSVRWRPRSRTPRRWTPRNSRRRRIRSRLGSVRSTLPAVANAPGEAAAPRSLTTRRDAFAPSRDGVSGSPCRSSCSFACGTRASACAAGCSADTCASCPRRSRLLRRSGRPTVYQTSIIVGDQPSSQRPCGPRGPRPHESIPVVAAVRVWYIPRPRQPDAPLPAGFPQGVEETVENPGCRALSLR